jgi:3-oxoacyl-[acyl-carrier-protein] synthase III
MFKGGKTMPGAQIVNVVNFMPERVVDNTQLVLSNSKDEELNKNPFFKGVKERRFASPEYQSSDLGTYALKKLLEQTDTKSEALDLILYSCLFSDFFLPNIGTVIQHRVGANRATVLNVDTGCSSYLSMLNTARAFIESGLYKTVAVITVTNYASRLATEDQYSKQYSVLGDGASATLLIDGKSSFLASYERSHGEHYGLLVVQPNQLNGCSLNYWEDGSGKLNITFSPDMLASLRSNALRLLPEAVNKCISMANLSCDDISLLITHQPNTVFVKKWRQRIGIREPRVHDTLEKYGNLFQGSIPVTLADAIENNKVQSGDLLALGTFSFGGEFVSSTVIRWG